MHTLAVAYFDAVKKQISSNYPISERDSTLWQCNRVKYVHDYLLAIHISGLHQCLGPRQFRVVVIYRLGILLFVEASLCSSCNKEMDIYGN